MGPPDEKTGEEISWIGDKVAFSKRFEDIYYAEEGGLEEARHTFLGANRIAERLAAGESLHIGELGFGTGLNFFALWQLWRSEPRPAHQTLQFSSLERFPLSTDEIRYTLSRWPELSPLVDEFLKHYILGGLELHLVLDSQVRLHLFFEDVSSGLPKFQDPIDAWFFDGFAPQKNPEMWNEATFRIAFEKSKPGATFSTFSVAGFVKRSAKAAGFAIEKKKGFGRKRELLTGCRLNTIVGTRSVTPPDVIVIGGGLAGTACAYELAARGLRVTLIERRERIASESSSHRAGLVQPVLSAEVIAASEWSRRGYHYLFRHIEDLADRTAPLPHALKGLFHIVPESRAYRNWAEAIRIFDATGEHVQSVDASTATDLCGTRITQSGIYFPHGGWVDPRALCDRRIAFYSDRIQVLTQSTAMKLERGQRDWEVSFASSPDVLHAPFVVLANASDLVAFDQAKALPVKRNRGQLVVLKSCETLKKLRIPISSDVYITPSLPEDLHVLGATADRHFLSLETREEDTLHLKDRVLALLPDLKAGDLNVVETSVQFRASAPGALPLVGPVSAEHGRSLLVCSGFSGRGLIGSTLGGLVIADLVTDAEAPPADLPQFVLNAIMRTPLLGTIPPSSQIC